MLYEVITDAVPEQVDEDDGEGEQCEEERNSHVGSHRKAAFSFRVGPYQGLPRYEARKKVVADLEALGLIEKIEDYTNNVGRSQRSGEIVEPRVSIV